MFEHPNAVGPATADVVDGYSYVLDQVPDTVPDLTSEGTQTSRTFAIADGEWYFHVRSHNAQGWSPASHLRLRSDTNASAPTVSSSTHPNEGAVSNNTKPKFDWTPPAYLSGYWESSYVLDQSPSTSPDTVGEGTATSTTYSQGVGDGTWWFHVRTRSNAGVWGATAHYRIVIDATAPTGAIPLVLSTTHVANVSSNIREAHMFWLAPDGEAANGVAGYSWAFSRSSTTPADAIIDTPTDKRIASSADDDDGRDGLTDGAYWFHVRSVDNAGNAGPDAVFGPILIDQSALIGLSPDLLSIPEAQSSGLGLEQFYPYDDVDLGGSARGYLNLRNGNLVIQQTDVSVAREGLNLVVTRTHNSQAGTRDHDGIGQGWTLGITDVDAGLDGALGGVTGFDPNSAVLIDDLVDIGVGGLRTVIGQVVELTDSDGTVHRFVRRGGAGARFDPPPGVGLRLQEELGALGERVALRFVRPDGVVYRAQRVATLAGLALHDQWRVTSIEDRNANTLSFTYAELNPLSPLTPRVGRVTAVRHSRGNETLASFGCDANGALATVTALPGTAAARPTSLARDAEGALVSAVQNPAATAAQGRRETTFTPSTAATTLTGFGRTGMLGAVTDPKGKATQFGYVRQDGAYRLNSVTDRRLKTWRWHYLGGGQPDVGERTTIAATPIFSSDFSDSHATAPVAGQTAYRTTGRSRVSVADRRIAGGNIAEIIDAGNGAGRVRPTFAWVQNLLVTKRDGAGNPTTMTYNDLGLLTSITEPAPNRASDLGADMNPALAEVAAMTTSSTSHLEYQFPTLLGVSNRYPATCVDPAPTSGPVSNEGYCLGVAELRRVRAADNSAAHRRVTDFGFDPKGNLTSVIERGASNPVPAIGATPGPTDRASAMTYYDRGALKTLDGPQPGPADVTIYGLTSDPVYGGYHECGSPTQITDSAGKVMGFEYTPHCRLSKRTDREGKATTYSYDLRDNLLSETRPGARTTAFTYDANERKLTQTSPRGVETSTGGDHTTTWDYDDNGWETTRTEPPSNGSGPAVFATAYFDDGVVSRTTSPTGANTTHTLHPNRSLSRVDAPADATRAITDYAWDVAGRVREIVAPGVNAAGDRPRATFDYTPAGAVWKRTETAAAGARITRSVFDPFGQVLATVGPRSVAGVLQQQVHVVDAFGQQTKLRRLKAGGVTPTWLDTVTSFDLAGNLVSSTQPTGIGGSLTATYAYDALNRRVAQTSDPTNPGHTVEWTYDAEGLQKKRIDKSSGTPVRTVETTYNLDNTVASEVSTDHLAGTTKAKCNYAEGAVPATGHDADGHVLVTRTLTGATTCTGGTEVAKQVLTWDEGATLKSSTQTVRSPKPGAGAVTRSQQFDYRNDRTLTTFTHGGQATNYTTTPAGWFSGLTEGSPVRSASVTYSPSGSPLTQSLGSLGGGPAAAAATWAHHPDGSVSGLTWRNAAGTPVRSHTGVTYDEGGQRVGEDIALMQTADAPATTSQGGHATFTYDLLDRLTSWTNAFKGNAVTDLTAPATTYGLSDGGDILTEAVRADTVIAGDQVVVATDITATYAAGRLTSQQTVTRTGAVTTNDITQAFAYQPAGQPLADALGEERLRTTTGTLGAGSRLTTLDASGRVTSVTGTDPPNADMTPVDYVYDAFDRVVARTSVDDGVTRYRLFFFWGTDADLVEETDGDGASQVRYTCAPDGDPLWQHQVAPVDRYVFLLDDIDGNMGTQLNADGTVAEQKPYAPYGKPSAAGASRLPGNQALGQILGHQKSMVDNAAGFTLLGARAYDWNINRFITPDTFVASELDVALGVDSLTGNRYLFAAANPVAFYEDGHWPKIKLRFPACKSCKKWGKRAVGVGLAVGVAAAGAVLVVPAGTGLAAAALGGIAAGYGTVVVGDGMQAYGQCRHSKTSNCGFAIGTILVSAGTGYTVVRAGAKGVKRAAKGVRWLVRSLGSVGVGGKGGSGPSNPAYCPTREMGGHC